MLYPVAQALLLVLLISAIVIYVIFPVAVRKKVSSMGAMQIIFVLAVVAAGVLTVQYLDAPAVPPVIDPADGSVVYVSADGKGDFNCDGVKDEVEINAALQYVGEHEDYDTVYLLDDGGDNDYIIQGTIEIPDDTTLTGDIGATVKLVSSFNPPRDDWQMVSGATRLSGRGYKQSNNVAVTNLTFDADRWNQPLIPMDMVDHYPTIEIRGKDLTFHDLSFTTGIGDFIKVINSGEQYPNLNIYNNYFGRSGHVGVYVLYTGSTGDNRIWIHDNVFGHVAANTGVRLDECSGALVERNTFTSFNSGDSAIYLTYKNDKSNTGSADNEIAYNTIYGVREYGIVLAAEVSGGKVDRSETTGNYIHHNLIYNTIGDDGNGGGISVYGYDNVRIESNTIANGEGDGISTKEYHGSTSTTGFTITATNNIITGMDTYDGRGYGINNIEHGSHTIISDHNNIYNNALGDYNHVDEGANDIHFDSLFYDEAGGNYHLRSTAGTWTGSGWEIMGDNSPCIDAGDVSSSYSNEPDPNGNRINIGRYGDTSEASKSYSGNPTISAIIKNIFSDDVEQDAPSDDGREGLNIVRGTATVDGDAGDWKDVAGISMDVASAKDTKKDSTASIKAMYDDSYIYFAFDVDDSDLQAEGLTETDGLHRDDSVEIYLDTLHNGGSAMQPDDYHFIINLNGAMVDDVGTGSGKDYDYSCDVVKRVMLQGSKNHAADLDAGYVIEVAIPWSDVGGRPSGVIGVFFAINDQDAGDVSFFNWYGLTGSYAVPDHWGDGTLQA
ncbi:sugar-binding protein [Methanococcoides sp. FTZ1]|uniref:sugar-binding protein n=1 Tax=Methanococcoides sp. FTZ1 TaxID=3439061 RepID=UPI003F8495BC